MFPRAAEMTAGEAIAPEVQAAPAEAPARPTTAWANPITFTQAAKPADAETKLDDGGSKASKDATKTSKNETTGAKHGKTTRAEQAIASLREKGPLSSKDLCEAMGIDAEVGISPYITQALKNGSIRRDRGRYFLPGQEASLPAPPAESACATPENKANEKPAAAASKPATTVKAADNAVKSDAGVVKPTGRDVKPYPREVDFTLGVGGAVLTRWLNGSVTLQRHDVVIELTRDEARLFAMCVDLCK